MALYFSRDTKVFLTQKNTADDAINIWEIPVLDGYSFTQAINSSEVTLNEMSNAAGDSRRGKKMFNDSLSPAEWSFSTYIRPFQGATGGDLDGDVSFNHAVEEALWANFVSAEQTFEPGSGVTPPAWANGVTHASSASPTVFDFLSSNKTTVGEFDLYFSLGANQSDRQVYKLVNCVVNSIGVDFEIDGISTMNVSGFGGIIEDSTKLYPGCDPADPTDTDLYSGNGQLIDEGTTSTANFIRNRLTTLAVQAETDGFYDNDVDSGYTYFPGASNNGVYNVAITSGSINFENNITFLTPETLGQVNSPIGHVAGSRSISGSFTSYLAVGDGEAGALFEQLVTNNTIITNSFALDFAIGGTQTPRVTVKFPKCHIEVPAHSIEDVISIEASFAALASDLDTADEATIEYLGA